METRDASRTFGCQDMYWNFNAVESDQHNFEKELSLLEPAAKVHSDQIRYVVNKDKAKDKKLQVHLLRGEKSL